MRLVLITAVAAVALSGCALRPMTPDDAVKVIKAFSDAGCGGKVDADLGANTGQLGGTASASVSVHGQCIPRKPAPLPDAP